MSGRLAVRPNITLHQRPPDAPELNSVGTGGGYMRGHFLSNQALADHDHMYAAATDAFNAITPERNRSVCGVPWLTYVGQTGFV